jgi:hypothetical protein
MDPKLPENPVEPPSNLPATAATPPATASAPSNETTTATLPQSNSATPPTSPDTTTARPPAHPLHISAYILALVTLLVGIGAGYYSVILFPKSKIQPLQAESSTAQLSLPKDAVVIESCSTNQGTLYIRPSDIPTGPVYMYNNGKVIGIEYMLDRTQFLNGKGFFDLTTLGVKVDHVNVAYLQSGHAGHTAPHYHVDLYTVPYSTEQKIKCSDNQQNDMMNMMDMGSTPSATVTPASTSPSMGMMQMQTSPTQASMTLAPSVSPVNTLH